MSLYQHLKVINKHKIYVTLYCFRFGLYKQGILHDLSKYSWCELKTGIKYYDGTKSPNGIERKLQGYSSAWLHHKGRNKHHWEYWVDFYEDGARAAEMPIEYIVEMFCDRVAATLVYKGKSAINEGPLDYYNNTKQYYIIGTKTQRILEDMLVYLSKHGLDESIKYIKKTYLKR